MKIGELHVGDENKEDETLYGHYGMSYKEFDTLVADMLRCAYVNSNRYTVIDEFFTELTADQRATVAAFSVAMEHIRKIVHSG